MMNGSGSRVCISDTPITTYASTNLTSTRESDRARASGENLKFTSFGGDELLLTLFAAFPEHIYIRWFQRSSPGILEGTTRWRAPMCSELDIEHTRTTHGSQVTFPTDNLKFTYGPLGTQSSRKHRNSGAYSGRVRGPTPHTVMDFAGTI